jgi:hypothetical protein
MPKRTWSSQLVLALAIHESVMPKARMPLGFVQIFAKTIGGRASPCKATTCCTEVIRAKPFRIRQN